MIELDWFNPERLEDMEDTVVEVDVEDRDTVVVKERLDIASVG